ncbi:MAG: LacI family DNA-binding transcriptional regulator [Spirochaetia bacterium]
MEEIKSPNLRTIADTAGVSISTVSRALKDHPAISEKTKNRIIDIARSLNYFNGNGAAGNGNRNKTLGIVYDPTITMHDYYFSTVIKNIVTEASLNEFQSTIKGLPNHGDIIVLIDELEEYCGAGIIFVGDIADDILFEAKERKLNAVIVDKPSRIITSVFNDNEWGSLPHHLVFNKHRLQKNRPVSRSGITLFYQGDNHRLQTGIVGAWHSFR